MIESTRVALVAEEPYPNEFDMNPSAADDQQSFVPPGVAPYPRGSRINTYFLTNGLVDRVELRSPTGFGALEVVRHHYVPGTSRLARIEAPGVDYDVSEHWTGVWEYIRNHNSTVGVTRTFEGPIVVGETWTAIDGGTSSVQRTIDDRLTISGMSVTSGARVYTLVPSMQDNGELASMQLGDDVVTYSRTFTDAPSTINGSEAGGISTTTTFNALGELAEDVVSFGGEEVYHQTIQLRDDAGRTRVRTERLGGPGASCRQTTNVYSYDAGRLSSWAGGSGPCARAPRLTTVNYTYDVDGNRTDGGLSGDAQGQPRSTVTPRTYDARGRLVARGSGMRAESFSYDVYDRLVQWTRSGSPTTRLEYDGVGRLITITQGSTRVDRQFQRFFYSGDSRIVAWERSGVGGTRTVLFGYGQMDHSPDVAWIDEGSDGLVDQMVRLIQDEMGSVRMVVDTNDGTVLETIDYDPWGAVARAGTVQPFGFAGGVFVPGPGLWHMGVRNLDPTIGRWTTPDPIQFDGGLNAYDYADSDPVDLIDPGGHNPFVIIGLGVAVCTAYLVVNGGSPSDAGANIAELALAEFAMGGCNGAGEGYGNCFAPETLVETEDGPRPIAEVRAGELVWSADMESGRSDWHRVLRTFQRSAIMLSLEFEDDVGDSDLVRVTTEHPFFSVERGWVSSSELFIGEHVIEIDGDVAELVRRTSEANTADVYNFEVEDAHTYFVGGLGLLAHNECEPPYRPTQSARRFDPSRVERYTADMRAGNWDWERNAMEPIIVDSSGNIMSGHHRVLAAFRAGVEIPQSAIQHYPGVSPRAPFEWGPILERFPLIP